MSARRVRVTVEGSAQRAGHASEVVRLITDDGAQMWIDTAAAGVTVEELAPPRTWTDGDVVQAQCSGLTYSRSGGEWLGWTQHSGKIGPHTDDETTANVQSGFLTVLRYQFTEDDQPAPHGAHCPDPCRHDAECPHGKAWTAGETCLPCATAEAE